MYILWGLIREGGVYFIFSLKRGAYEGGGLI